MDTRTPRADSGGDRSGFIGDATELNTVKVPCDPSQIIVNHASFRVEFAAPPPPPGSSPRLEGAPLGSIAVRRKPAAARTRRPVVWSGHAASGDAGAGSLLQAVQDAGAGVSTQVLPRVTDTATLPRVPSVVGPRGPGAGEGPRLTPDPRERFDGYDHDDHDDDHRSEDRAADRATTTQTGRPDARQGYYPGRRLSLGIVLLPLRLLLGFITITAGFAKLTDPVYFDGGERGSMVTWLSSLEPWALAGPLHQWALAHPVGAGLTVAFTQIIVGVLTIAGLWQRLAAVLGALLSLALVVTVAWQSGPAYDAPDIILLAAWSPLIIAGAPVYSLDGRLAGEAWRTLGPRVPVSELRRRVLRRGALLAMLLLGTTLLLGSLLGSAVRSAELTTVPRPGEPPRNSQQGVSLPGEEDEEDEEDAVEEQATESPSLGDPGGATPGESPAGGAESPADEAPADTSGPATEQTVPDSGSNPGTAPEQQQAPPAQQPGGGQEVPAPPPPAEDGSGGGGGGGGTGGEEQAPPEDSGSSDDGGDGGSLGRIGGLLG
ncbi:DoxX family protein [Streptomyces sp. SM12]|uniref:DoxX family protein n=1 Tax=Streptomyces sp. SM12 TaxID=1071602 RepID=UPI000CD4D105|nr:DoxX family protein [Streptomyces sp. SM12]